MESKFTDGFQTRREREVFNFCTIECKYAYLLELAAGGERKRSQFLTHEKGIHVDCLHAGWYHDGRQARGFKGIHSN